MDQNDKNNKNRRGNRNLLGAVKLVAWALVLTLVFYCTSSYMGSAGKQASNINIKYSDFIAMMEGKQVEDVTVDLSEGLLYIVPKDGYVYTAENGTPTPSPRIRMARPFTPLPTPTARSIPRR